MSTKPYTAADVLVKLGMVLSHVKHTSSRNEYGAGYATGLAQGLLIALGEMHLNEPRLEVTEKVLFFKFKRRESEREFTLRIAKRMLERHTEQQSGAAQ